VSIAIESKAVLDTAFEPARPSQKCRNRSNTNSGCSICAWDCTFPSMARPAGSG